jgi:hypothetical protein
MNRLSRIKAAGLLLAATVTVTWGRMECAVRAEMDRPPQTAEVEAPAVPTHLRPIAAVPFDGEALAPARQPSPGAEFNTMADAKAASLNNPPAYLRLAGYFAPGDNGGGLYRAIARPALHAGKFQTADGQWWELAESLVRPEQLGAKGDGSDDTTAISNWLGFIASRAIGFLPAKRFVVGPIRAMALRNVTIYGAGREVSTLSPRDPNQSYVLHLSTDCARWELRHFSFNGGTQKSDPPLALLISEGTQINARSMTFDTARVGAWFKRGGYCVCDDWFVASCTEAYVRTGGDTSGRSQFSESTFSNFVLDARWELTNPAVTAANYLVADKALGIGLDFDFGSAYLKLDHMTGAGMKFGAVLHNSSTGDAWPSRASAPDGIYFTDFNFDWVAHEAFKVDNANLVVVDRAWCRSLLTYAARIANFGNAHLRSFYGYASHLGGLEIAGSFYEANLQDPGLAGNAWPSNSGGRDLHLTGALSDKQGLVKLLGGEIACSDGLKYFPVNAVGNISDYGVVAEPGFSAELVMDNVYFRGHSKAESIGLIGRGNTIVRNCRGVAPTATTPGTHEE